MAPTSSLSPEQRASAPAYPVAHPTPEPDHDSLARIEHCLTTVRAMRARACLMEYPPGHPDATTRPPHAMAFVREHGEPEAWLARHR